MATVDKDPTRAKTPYVVRWRDEAGRQRKRGFARKVDADRYRAEVEHSLNTGTYVDHAAGATTFASFFAEWSARQLWAPGTLTAHQLAAGSVTFGGVPLRQIRRSHVESWVKAMEARGLAPGTIRTRYNNVHAVLRGAVRDRLIGLDPADGIVLPRGRRAAVAMVLPTAAQVRSLFDAAEPRFTAFIALCAFAGLRLGEAAAVEVADVDFLRRTLAVGWQHQRAGKGTVSRTRPKHGSERTVYLAPGLVDILSAHVAEHVPARSGLLFRKANREPFDQDAAGGTWERVRAAVGLPTVRLHDLRHFYASGLIASGCDVVTVQRALGHASATTTLRTYAHLWPTAEDRTRAAAAAMLGDVLGADVPKMRPTATG
jgi:integrase